MYTALGGKPPASVDQVPKPLRGIYNTWKNMDDMHNKIDHIHEDSSITPEEKLKRLQNETNQFNEAGYNELDPSGSGSKTETGNGSGGIIGIISRLPEAWNQNNAASSHQAPAENPEPSEYSTPEKWIDWLTEKYRQTKNEKKTAEEELKAREGETQAMEDEEARAQEDLAHAEENLHYREEDLRKVNALTDQDLVKPEQEKLTKEWNEEREKIKNSNLPESEKKAKIAELAEAHLKKMNRLWTPEEKKKRQEILDQKKREAKARRVQAEKELQAAQEKAKQVKAKRAAWEEAKEAAKKKIAESDAKLQKIRQDSEKYFQELAENGRRQRREEEVRAAAGNAEYKNPEQIRKEEDRRTWDVYQALGLDQYQAATIPNGPVEPVNPVDEGFKNAVQTFLEDKGGGPVPTDTIDVLHGTYQAVSQFFDPNNAGGGRRIMNFLLSKGYSAQEATEMLGKLREMHQKLGNKLKPADLLELEETPGK